MAGLQVSTSVSIIDSTPVNALSLTELTTSAAAAIAAGSFVSVASGKFYFSGDETIKSTSWTAIATGTTAYIALTASGTAGSQIVEASYVADAPTWRDDLQGWYASAASEVRIIGSVYKAEATSYYPKILFDNVQKEDPFTVVNVSVSSSLTVAGTGTFSGAASVASSLTVAGSPAATFSDTASVRSTIFPIGSIFPMMVSGASVALNATVVPGYVSAATPIIVANSAYGTIVAFSGTWVARGLCAVSTGGWEAVLVQRIS